MHLAISLPAHGDSTATELAGRIALAHARYSLLCCGTVIDDLAADLAISDYCDQLAELAALEAVGPAGISAKAAALRTCIVHHVGQPSTIEGDCGLAMSLLRDLRRPGAWGHDIDSIHTLSRLIEEPICCTLGVLGREPRLADEVSP